jgi:hypothetical protein
VRSEAQDQSGEGAVLLGTGDDDRSESATAFAGLRNGRNTPQITADLKEK